MKFIFTIIAVLVCCFHIQAQPGTLDYSFGDSGKVIATTYEGQARTSLLQTDGRIIVGGSGIYSDGGITSSSSLLARYNPNGSPDTSFGNKGIALYNIGQPIINSGFVYALALQADGKIVAAVTGYNTMALIRVNSDGTVDESFGEGGLALGPTNDGYIATTIAILPDRRIVITGDVRLEVNDNSRCFITCFMSDGKLDLGFGERGTTITELSSPLNITSVAITQSGKIVIGGNYNFLNKTLLLGFNGDGTHDESFGKNGLAEMPFDKSITDPALTDLAIADDNKLVASGWCIFNSRTEIAFASRFLPNGTPDSTFGGAGYAVAKSGEGDLHANATAVQQDGRIVLGGFLDKSNTVFKFAVMRFDADGGLDSTYGTNGIALTEFPGGGIAYSMVLQKDGKAVLAGDTYDSELDRYAIVLARYKGDGSQKQNFITRIKRWLQHHGITWQTDNNVRYYNVQRSLDGGITYQAVAKLYNNHQSLSYEDATAGNNTLYRVTAVGKDGSRSLSNSILISSEAGVKVFPNPVRNTLQLQGLPANSKTNITVIDFNGTVRTSATGSGGSLSINTTTLTPGNYLLKVQSGSTTVTQTFMKE